MRGAVMCERAGWTDSTAFPLMLFMSFLFVFGVNPHSNPHLQYFIVSSERNIVRFQSASAFGSFEKIIFSSLFNISVWLFNLPSYQSLTYTSNFVGTFLQLCTIVHTGEVVNRLKGNRGREEKRRWHVSGS